MKLSKEELKKLVSEKVEDQDLAIELLEDIEDSMEIEDTTELDSLKAEAETLKTEIESLKAKYKERFLSSEEVPAEEESSEETDEEEPLKYEDLFDDEGGLK